jgi:hypothetical protein
LLPLNISVADVAPPYVKRPAPPPATDSPAFLARLQAALVKYLAAMPGHSSAWQPAHACRPDALPLRSPTTVLQLLGFTRAPSSSLPRRAGNLPKVGLFLRSQKLTPAMGLKRYILSRSDLFTYIDE